MPSASWSEDDVKKILCNPLYTGLKIGPAYTLDRPATISEDQFIQAGARMIQEIGAEAYLKQLLANLKDPGSVVSQ